MIKNSLEVNIKRLSIDNASDYFIVNILFIKFSRPYAFEERLYFLVFTNDKCILYKLS